MLLNESIQVGDVVWRSKDRSGLKQYRSNERETWEMFIVPQLGGDDALRKMPRLELTRLLYPDLRAAPAPPWTLVIASGGS